ncbi:hypothetical protein BURMUCGD2M_4964 [Burkholderia multivorans CGD2M]|uniref:Uncharacterized protein n=1 Tax=Burkholderia multivorans CGD2 TaxID=513052 RepID=B9BIR5_9BURK|nr:hypothetical protein BURMUCGD2_4971 [Burkholderia multivorans CGD2]EEE15521.1 hypothetical protein BURMUCGD2M_4964 [Burkholderia multivorans CGD2M]
MPSPVCFAITNAAHGWRTTNSLLAVFNNAVRVTFGGV